MPKLKDKMDFFPNDKGFMLSTSLTCLAIDKGYKGDLVSNWGKDEGKWEPLPRMLLGDLMPFLKKHGFRVEVETISKSDSTIIWRVYENGEDVLVGVKTFEDISSFTEAAEEALRNALECIK